MSNSQQSVEAFEQAARRLHVQWEATADQWRDGVQQKFAREYYAPLQQEHERMAHNAQHLAAILHKAQRIIR